MTPANASAIIITRPLAQAEALAPRIAALGLRPILFPLLEILQLADSRPLQAAFSRLADYALVMFVSPNAIDAAFRHIPPWPPGVAIGIVGAGSRAALARYGVNDANTRIFAPAADDKTDSEGLLAALDLPALQGRRVLIVRGQSGRDFLTEALRGAGVQTEHVAAYERVAPRPTPELLAQLNALLEGDNCWIITSSEALRNLLQMLPQTGLDDAVVKMQHKRIVVPHPRIAETARRAGFSRVTLTGSGDERLLAALQSGT